MFYLIIPNLTAGNTDNDLFNKSARAIVQRLYITVESEQSAYDEKFPYEHRTLTQKYIVARRYAHVIAEDAEGKQISEQRETVWR